MNGELTAEAAEYGRQASRAFAAAGGDLVVQQAELDPQQREALLGPVFGALGAWELEPRKDDDELEAAAALCRAAGYWALPYPVAERLARPAGLEVDGLVVVAPGAPAGAVAGLDLRWAAVTLDGVRSSVHVREPGGSPRATAFVSPLDLRPLDEDGRDDVALGLVLPCWTLLGMADRALELARAHVLMRTQFGRPLAKFQGVQFQLTDAEVERSGLEVLAAHALWSVQSGQPTALEDALALRFAALEAMDLVFRVAHQLHGAIGFCDETALSWISRYSLPLRRLPFGLSTTQDELTRRIGRRGLTGLFSDVVAP